MAPDDNSTPLQTMSYWNALIVSGSRVSSASSPPCGIENGLWLNSILPVSGFNSYIGKSTIQQNLYSSLAMRSISSASLRRAVPANFAAAAAFWSATKNTASPSPTPATARSRSSREESRNLAIGPFAPPPSKTTYPRPGAPSPRAQSFSLSKKLRGRAAAPGAGMARTTPPLATRLANTPKLEPANDSLASATTSGLRKSGLSEPYLSIASSYGMRGNGGLVTARPPPNSSNTPASTGSIAAKTSSWVTNDISKSSW